MALQFQDFQFSYGPIRATSPFMSSYFSCMTLRCRWTSYLRADWSKTVPPDPAAVRSAVQDFAEYSVDPTTVRDRLLALMRRHRLAYVEPLNRLGSTGGTDPAAEVARILGGK